jgi:hypothetical protein
MTSLIAPIVPSSSPTRVSSSSASARRPLSLAALPAASDHQLFCGVSTIDTKGRVTGSAVLSILGWPPGTRLDIHFQSSLIIIASNPNGVFAVTDQGYLRLPIAVRRWCALGPGSRVLLAADVAGQRLTVFPPAAVDAMVMGYQTSALGGGAS